MASIAQSVSLVTVALAERRLCLRADETITITKDYPSLLEFEANSPTAGKTTIRFQNIPSKTYPGHLDLEIDVRPEGREPDYRDHMLLDALVALCTDKGAQPFPRDPFSCRKGRTRGYL